MDLLNALNKGPVVLPLAKFIKNCINTTCNFHSFFSGNQPQANVQFYTSDAIEKQFGRLSQIFVFVSNYTKTVVRENAQYGVPAQRPLFMEFPNDTVSWTISYQYMFGSDLLVAPVIESNVTTMKVYLPSGEWGFIWDTTDRAGNQYVTVPSPIGKPPAFYRKSSPFADMFSQIQSKFPLPSDVLGNNIPVVIGKREYSDIYR